MVGLPVPLVDDDVVVLAVVEVEEVVVVVVVDDTLTNWDLASSQIAKGCGFDGSNSNRPSPVSQQPGEWSQQKDVSLPVTLAHDGR